MSFVDVLIPGVIGLLLAANPNMFTKATGDASVDGPRWQNLRTIGVVLIGVAGMYLYMKLGS